MTAAAAHLARAGQVRAAETLLTCASLILEYGDTWWDGHDDYIYDVKLTIMSSAEAISLLLDIDKVSKEVTSAFSRAVGFFRDSSGKFRRGNLVKLQPLIADTVIDEARLKQRKARGAGQLE